MSSNNGNSNDVQKTVPPKVRASHHNAFYEDQLAPKIGPWIEFPDGIPRNNWMFNVVPLPAGSTITAISGVAEWTQDGTNVATIVTINGLGQFPAQNIPADKFRVRINSVTLGTAFGYRVGWTAGVT